MKVIEKESIFIINQFEVLKESENVFIDFFSSHIKLISSQPGNIESRLFKSKESGNHMIYISIVGWKNEEAFKNAGIEIDSISKEKGIDIRGFQEKYKIKVINHISSEVPVL